MLCFALLVDDEEIVRLANGYRAVILKHLKVARKQISATQWIYTALTPKFQAEFESQAHVSTVAERAISPVSDSSETSSTICSNDLNTSPIVKPQQCNSPVIRLIENNVTIVNTAVIEEAVKMKTESEENPTAANSVLTEEKSNATVVERYVHYIVFEDCVTCLITTHS
jgi:hypothetical protein